MPFQVAPQVDTGSIDAAKNKASEAGTALDGLNRTVNPTVRAPGTVRSKVAAVLADGHGAAKFRRQRQPRPQTVAADPDRKERPKPKVAAIDPDRAQRPAPVVDPDRSQRDPPKPVQTAAVDPDRFQRDEPEKVAENAPAPTKAAPP